MSIKTTLKLTALSTLAALAFTSHAQAEGKLNVYCSVQNVVCEKVTQAFSKKYNVDAQFVRNSTGVVLGKIKAEKENPQADFWFGGTIEPHLQAAELGLLESYRSPLQKDIMPQFKSLMDRRGNFTSVIYLMELGIGVKMLCRSNKTRISRANSISRSTCFWYGLFPYQHFFHIMGRRKSFWLFKKIRAKSHATYQNRPCEQLFG